MSCFSYRGHVPTIKFAYADTFGHETAKYFQDVRNDALRSSRTIYNKGGNFPTVFSHNPDLVNTIMNVLTQRVIFPSFRASNSDETSECLFHLHN